MPDLPTSRILLATALISLFALADLAWAWVPGVGLGFGLGFWFARPTAFGSRSGSDER